MIEVETKTERIRRLNDLLRTSFVGGKVVITRGIQKLDETIRAEILAAVIEFDAFCEDNDPNQEHDFLAVQVQQFRVFAKIDYYDKQMQFLSPDPSDPEQTTRVLSILLAEEY